MLAVAAGDRAAPPVEVRRGGGGRRAGHHRHPGRLRPALVVAGAGRRRGRHGLRHGRGRGRSTRGPRWPGPRWPASSPCTRSAPAWCGRGRPRWRWVSIALIGAWWWPARPADAVRDPPRWTDIRRRDGHSPAAPACSVGRRGAAGAARCSRCPARWRPWPPSSARSPQVMLTAALAASSLGLAAAGAGPAGRFRSTCRGHRRPGRRRDRHRGRVAAHRPARPALYAAAAALLGVLAELLRGHHPATGLTRRAGPPLVACCSDGGAAPSCRPSGLRGRWLVSPATGRGGRRGAAHRAGAGLHRAGAACRAGRPVAAAQPDLGRAGRRRCSTRRPARSTARSVLAALLLTIAAALAAHRASAAAAARAVPVILPGARGHPADRPDRAGHALAGDARSAGAGGLHHLDARPGPDPAAAIADPARSLRTTRMLVFVIGLARRRRRPGRQPRHPGS